MSVSKRANWVCFRFDFRFQGHRYSGSTGQTTKAAAQRVEQEIRRALVTRSRDVSQVRVERTPTFTAWASVFIAYKQQHLKRPDHVVWVVGALLRFFGAAPPGVHPTAAAPFHDLRLGDVMVNRRWLGRFEAWMNRRGLGAHSQRHYRGMLRRMFALAMSPRYQAKTHVTMNPFLTGEPAR